MPLSVAEVDETPDVVLDKPEGGDAVDGPQPTMIGKPEVGDPTIGMAEVDEAQEEGVLFLVD